MIQTLFSMFVITVYVFYFSPHFSFHQESLLHGKILPCGILDGFTVKLGASGLFMPKQVVLPVTTFWFNVSEHQAASPYLVRERSCVK
jgi:hypothetical protein